MKLRSTARPFIPIPKTHLPTQKSLNDSMYNNLNSNKLPSQAQVNRAMANVYPIPHNRQSAQAKAKAKATRLRQRIATHTRMAEKHVEAAQRLLELSKPP
jgi:DNA-binding transcriptional MocR family regulator